VLSHVFHVTITHMKIMTPTLPDLYIYVIYMWVPTCIPCLLYICVLYMCSIYVFYIYLCSVYVFYICVLYMCSIYVFSHVFHDDDDTHSTCLLTCILYVLFNRVTHTCVTRLCVLLTRHILRVSFNSICSTVSIEYI